MKKFYVDELYDLIWYRPVDLIARGLYAFVERPLIAGSISAVTGAAASARVSWAAPRTGSCGRTRSRSRAGSRSSPSSS